MIAIRERHGKDADRRFAEPPWDEQTPRWQEIDQSLPADHLARQIDEVVGELDLAGLFATYSGRGSKALWPDLLLRLVLYEMQRGRLSPAEWFLDARENEPAQWLLFGMKPSRTALYEFLDRLQGFWDDWNEQVLHKAQELGAAGGRSRSPGRDADCSLGLASSVGQSENVDGAVGTIAAKLSLRKPRANPSRARRVGWPSIRRPVKVNSRGISRPKHGWTNCRRRTQIARVPSEKSRRKSW